MRNFKRIEPRWKVWSGRHNLPRQVGLIVAGFCHIWPHLDDEVYIQWKVRERMREREREYRNRVLLYLSDCEEEEERKILACQLYFSMNDFSPPPLPPHLFWPPLSFSVLRELGYHFHFIASVAYKKRERKKEMAWPRSYQNFKDQLMGWTGSVERVWAPNTWDLLVGPTHGTF